MSEEVFLIDHLLSEGRLDGLADVKGVPLDHAGRTMLAALRHQYVLAFESAGAGGWKPLDVRLRRRELTVRARSGYVVPAQAGSRQ